MPANLKLVHARPNPILQRVGRKSDAELGREGHKYLTSEQVEALIRAARQNRHGQRDGLMISLAWHHGLRASELVGLRWSDNRLAAGGHCRDAAQERQKHAPTAGRWRSPGASGDLP